MELYQKLTKFKLDAVGHAFGMETKQRVKYRDTLVANSLSSIGNKVFLDPNSVDAYKTQLDTLEATLKTDGKDKEALKLWRREADSVLYQQQTDGFMANNQLGEALQVISSAKVIDTMDTNDYMKLTGRYLSALDDYTKKEKQNTDIQAALNARRAGIDYPNAPMADKAAEIDFKEYLQATGLANLPMIEEQDVGSATTNLMSYFNARPVNMGNFINNFMSGKIATSGNPNEVAVLSRVVNQMATDPTGKLNKLVAQMDDKVKNQALMIADRLNAGDPISLAVQQVRDVVNVKYPVDTNALNAFNKRGTDNDYSTYKSDVNAAFGLNWSWNSADADVSRLAYSLPNKIKEYANAGFALDRAKELALTDLKRTAAYTEINGQGQVMVGAPSVYYQGRDLDVVEGLIKDGLNKHATSLGLEEVSGNKGVYMAADGKKRELSLGIKQWEGVTQYGDNNSRKYLVTDLDTGEVIRNPKNPLELATIDIKLNETEYQRKNQSYLDDLQKKVAYRKLTMASSAKYGIDTIKHLQELKMKGGK